MARPSKLTDKQWDAINQRLLKGESVSALATEFKVSRATISTRGKKPLENVKVVANQLVAAESALRSMPVSEQLLTLNLADTLRSISAHAAGAGNYGMAVAHRLAGISHGIMQQVDDADPLASMESMKAIAVLTKMQNDASQIGMNLLAANKSDKPPEPTNVRSGLAQFFED